MKKVKYNNYVDLLFYSIFCLVCAILICLFIWSILEYMGVCSLPNGDSQEMVEVEAMTEDAPIIDSQMLKDGCKIMLKDGCYQYENFYIEVNETQMTVTIYSQDGVPSYSWEYENVVSISHEKGLIVSVDGIPSNPIYSNNL